MTTFLFFPEATTQSNWALRLSLYQIAISRGIKMALRKLRRPLFIQAFLSHFSKLENISASPATLTTRLLCSVLVSGTFIRIMKYGKHSINASVFARFLSVWRRNLAAIALRKVKTGSLRAVTHVCSLSSGRRADNHSLKSYRSFAVRDFGNSYPVQPIPAC